MVWLVVKKTFLRQTVRDKFENGTVSRKNVACRCGIHTHEAEQHKKKDFEYLLPPVMNRSTSFVIDIFSKFFCTAAFSVFHSHVIAFFFILFMKVPSQSSVKQLYCLNNYSNDDWLILTWSFSSSFSCTPSLRRFPSLPHFSFVPPPPPGRFIFSITIFRPVIWLWKIGDWACRTGASFRASTVTLRSALLHWRATEFDRVLFLNRF